MNAEGIMDIIEADTESRRKLAMNELSGKTSHLIRDLREKVVEILTNIEVNIDYPEYEDIEVLTNEKILPEVKKIKYEIQEAITNAQTGKLLNTGIKIGIIGKPNVGKSSLLNTLLEEDKAIVTDIEGTTRDIVEGKFVLNGIVCHITDTAGIRETNNIVEKIGVTKSFEIINNSDLIIFMLNNNEKLSNEEKEIQVYTIDTKTQVKRTRKIPKTNKYVKQI